jgi:hypothetical protein
MRLFPVFQPPFFSLMVSQEIARNRALQLLHL